MCIFGLSMYGFFHNKPFLRTFTANHALNLFFFFSWSSWGERREDSVDLHINIQIPPPHPHFCFGREILWYSASSTRAQIFVLRCSQVDLAWGTVFPELWLDACADTQVALSVSCVSVKPVSGGLENRQGWAEGQTATWQRTEVCWSSQTDTGTGCLVSPVVDWQRSKLSG